MQKYGVCFFFLSVLSFSESDALFIRRGFEEVLRHALWVDFDAVFNVISLSDAVESSHFRR